MSTSSPKSRFAKFLDQFAIGLEDEKGTFKYVHWHGNVGYVDVAKGIIARIEFSDAGYVDHYDKFVVSVVNAATGKLDVVTFNFNDYLTKADRVDNRVSDQPDQRFHAWSGGVSKDREVDWYIAKPRSVKAFSNAVNEYLRMWQRAT